MSDATPAADVSSPENNSPPNNGQDPQNASSTDRLVIEYLRARGHASAEQALLEAIDSGDLNDKGKGPEIATISTEELVKRLAVYAEKPTRPGENVLRDSANVLQELTTMGNPTNIQSLIASIGAVGAEEILSLDPTDKQDGFTELEAWVDGSLDMYRVSQQFRCEFHIYRLL
jgi:transcription initiation factor TFIID subunit 5